MSTPLPTVEDGTLSRLIRKFLYFAARFEDNQLKMKPIPQGAAHIVVHYLYTGCYEGLKALRT
ncbi:hypothetical protein CEP53_007193 [Fusarium sp. AF-6]|nr:hypothetical protein CEP53_007193 [Fusarium sp. AF-6]